MGGGSYKVFTHIPKNPPSFEIWCPEARIVIDTDPGTLQVKEGVLTFRANGKTQYIIGEKCFAFEKDTE